MTSQELAKKITTEPIISVDHARATWEVAYQLAKLNERQDAQYEEEQQQRQENLELDAQDNADRDNRMAVLQQQMNHLMVLLQNMASPIRIASNPPAVVPQ